MILHFIHSMTADSPIHGSAMLMMNSGRILSGQPGPRFVGQLWSGLGQRKSARIRGDARSDRGPISGAKNWSSGYMPATYQGT